MKKHFWNYYIFHPTKAETKAQKIQYWVASTVLGVLSGGFVHLGCLLIKKVSMRKVPKADSPTICVDQEYDPSLIEMSIAAESAMRTFMLK